MLTLRRDPTEQEQTAAATRLEQAMTAILDEIRTTTSTGVRADQIGVLVVDEPAREQLQAHPHLFSKPLAEPGPLGLVVTILPVEHAQELFSRLQIPKPEQEPGILLGAVVNGIALSTRVNLD